MTSHHKVAMPTISDLSEIGFHFQNVMDQTALNTFAHVLEIQVLGSNMDLRVFSLLTNVSEPSALPPRFATMTFQLHDCTFHDKHTTVETFATANLCQAFVTSEKRLSELDV